jgi:hypothetical protein
MTTIETGEHGERRIVRDGDPDKPRYHEERECGRCGAHVVWTGFYSFDGNWEHCDDGYSGQLSCYS